VLHAAPPEPRPTRHIVAALCALVAVVVVAWSVLAVVRTDDEASDEAADAATLAGTSADSVALATTTSSSEPATTTSTTSPLLHIPAGPPSDQRKLALVRTIGGAITPKSVVASGAGRIIAQNMMYQHSITVYDEAGALVATIPDSVDLAAFGLAATPTVVKGAPVEAAFTPDARHAYVSNYAMYGPGQGPEGQDSCSPSAAKGRGETPSYVYRIDMETLLIDQVIPVGLVPKYVAVTHDGTKVLVSNWCSWDLTVIDVATAKPVATVPLQATPRGIAVSPDSSTAYVTIMGGSTLAQVDLASNTVVRSIQVGSNPRHVVLDPAGTTAYVSLNSGGQVVKVDLGSGAVVGRAGTGQLARSLAISTDGLSLYVVNYGSASMTKLRASDMTPLQTVPTGVNPIGVTYDPLTGNVWVAIYGGQLMVFADA
jgi:YVTN family beta-propeller protein